MGSRDSLVIKFFQTVARPHYQLVGSVKDIIAKISNDFNLFKNMGSICCKSFVVFYVLRVILNKKKKKLYAP